MPDLRPRWPRRALALNWVAGLAIVALAFGWPPSSPGPAPARTSAPGSTAAAGPLHLQSARLRIDAPAYTGQATLTQSTLDAKVAADSTLSWSLRFDRAPDKAWLQFHDGRRLPLSQRDGQWQAEDVARTPVLYRVVSEPALAEARLHRLDVVADRAPSVRVLEPAATLVPGTPGHASGRCASRPAMTTPWPRRQRCRSPSRRAAARTSPSFAAVSASSAAAKQPARRSRIPRPGRAGRATRQRCHRPAGGTRQPRADAADRAQQQCDPAPAQRRRRARCRAGRTDQEDPAGLLPQPAADHHRCRSADPAATRPCRRRLREAQRCDRRRPAHPAPALWPVPGRESEGAPKPPPTSDLPTSDAPTADSHDDDHDHDHGAGCRSARRAWPRSRGKPATADTPPVFGSDTDVLSEYGHTHDHAEAATLLDPQTRRHPEGRAGPDVVGRRRAAPGAPAAGAAVRVQGPGFHQAGAAGRTHLSGPGRAGAAADR